MRMFAMPEECHKVLKDRAAEMDITMTQLLRMALAAYFDDPSLDPVSAARDARTKTWHVVVYMWSDGSLAHTLRATVGNTAELPDLAERACRGASAPHEGVAAYVRSELPRLRQNLARLQSTSLRVEHGLWLCQVDVHREKPES